MTAPSDSGLSSPPSILSSPLSSLASSPSPPPEMPLLPAPLCADPYLSPPSSQQTSHSCSPVPDGMDSSANADKDCSRPTKRRRTSKERSTDYLDLRYGEVELDQRESLDRLLHVLHKSQKIVVIAGAGISVSAGIPDFRSSTGLFRSLKDEHKLKGSGKHLFDASVYKDDTATSSFHDMVSSMSRLTRGTKPTAFHHMLATIATDGRLLRLYSQNVDGIDTSLDPLKTRVPLQKDGEGKWPRTVQLHGGLDKMICSKCNDISDFDADIFSGSIPPLCPRCERINDIRTNHEGKRSHGIGRLRPRMVLYNEHNPDDIAIGSVTRDDLRRRPDAVIVVGTSLRVPGVRRIVREMCGIVRDRRGGVTIWINTDPPPVSKDMEDCFDIVVQSTCDEVANRAAMRRWNDPIEHDTFSEISDEDAKRASIKKALVHLPSLPVKPNCQLTHASYKALPSSTHINNSFRPPRPDATPKKAPNHGPDDWSPITYSRTSVIPSIEGFEHEDDSFTSNYTGLLTPSKSQKHSPAEKLPSFNDKLKDAGKVKNPVGRPRKTQCKVKYAKPAVGAAKKTTGAKSQSGLNPKASITNNFKATKAASGAPNVVIKKALASPASSPSKLRQVLNTSSTEPMHPLPPHDPRHNTSPAKPKPFFPGLQTENMIETQQKRMTVAGMMN